MSASELLEPGELGTYTGAIVATVAITNGLYVAFGGFPRWIGLLVAAAISSFGVILEDPSNWRTWLLALPNAFIIYVGAAGLSAMVGTQGGDHVRVARRRPRAGGERVRATEEIDSRRSWRVPWY